MKLMPVVCRLTAPLPAAIATLQLMGDQAYEMLLASGLVTKTELEIGRINYCLWPLSNGQETVHEQLVICRTQDQRIEICCHGGIAVCQAIIDSLVKQGFSEADFEDLPSQYRCPIQQAAEADLMQAKTDRAAAILLD